MRDKYPPPSSFPVQAGPAPGLQTRYQTAAKYARSVRTIIRWEAGGMPVIVLGSLRLHDPVAVEDWMRTHERRHQPPKIGRPRKTKI